MRNDDRVMMELVVRGEVVMEATCKMIIRNIKDLHKKWYYAYGLASKHDWEIYIRMPSKMDEDKKTIFFPKKNVIFEIQNTKHNETSTDTTDGKFSEPADY
jgi:hypothetical protein